MKRFWNKVDKTDTCWLWTGCLTLDKYGRFWFNNKIILAHRFSWEFHNGAIPEELFVCHKCDVRNCVNPDHLFIGTNDDNMKDMKQKGRADRTKKNKGEDVHFHVLTEEQVLDIRSRSKYHGLLSDLAKEFNLTPSGINRIIKRKTWKHL